IAAHHAVAAVPAHVQEGVELALAIAGENHRVFAHICMEKVVDLRHEALVPNHQPGTGKDFRHLLVIDGLVDEDTPVNLASLRVNDDVLLRGTHTAISPGQPAWCVSDAVASL